MAGAQGIFYAPSRPMDDRPQPQFRGWWIPADVVQHFRSRELNAQEMILLATIDSLVSPKDGCFASNAYLAEVMGVKERALQLMLAKLRRMGLVIDVDGAGHRSLETAWSRVRGGRKKLRPKGAKNCAHSKQAIDTSYLSTGPDGPSTVLGKGKSMPFFADLEDAKKTKERGKASQADIERAKKLEDALRRRNKLFRQVNRAAWADAFRKMQEADAIPADKLDRVLNWYAAKIGQQYVPQAFSAKAFRERWPAIVEAMGRDKTTIIASDVAQDIAAKLTRTPWPKGSGPQVIAAVQMSLDAFDDFAKRRRELLARTDNAKLKRWLPKLDELLGTRKTFVAGWMEGVRQRVERWPNWSGHLTSLAFDPQSDDATKYGRNLSHSYSGSDALWDATMKGCYEV